MASRYIAQKGNVIVQSTGLVRLEYFEYKKDMGEEGRIEALEQARVAIEAEMQKLIKNQKLRVQKLNYEGRPLKEGVQLVPATCSECKGEKTSTNRKSGMKQQCEKCRGRGTVQVAV